MHCYNVIFTILVGAVFASSFDLDLSDTYCDGTGWVVYKDEKCFKLIEKWSTRDEAKDICAQELLKTDSSTPQLVLIKSAEEQDYLTEFVFDKPEFEANIWIGAKRQLGNGNNFVWDDGSDVEFNNWAEGSPSEDTDVGCVIMQSRFNRAAFNISKLENRSRINGHWRDVGCRLANYVVCEKLQRWSFGKLQQTLLQQRKELSDTKIELSEAKNELSDTKNESNKNKNKLTNIQQNPVPINFVYVQLPHQPEPKLLWSAVQWKDVTSEYAGMFFRAEGGGAAEFGTKQEENAPRVTSVVLERHTNPGDTSWFSTTLNVGGASSGLGIFTGSYYGNEHYTQRFYQSGGEVRPKNMAMRVWKRVA